MKTQVNYQFPGCHVSVEGPSFLVLCESCPESPTNWASRSCLLKRVDRDLFPGPPHHLSSTRKYNNNVTNNIYI